MTVADWSDGAITDVVARRRFHRELTPVWLSTACALLASRAPAPAGPLRYADLGCGAGFDALTVAATCPDAEVWGFDINPSHIEAARELAAQAGLANARFVETSFAAMTAMAADALPAFDVMVAEAVAHVISRENRAHLFQLIGRLLRPGGIACVGYACEAGWSAFEPVRTLMHLLYETGTEASEFAAAKALQWPRRMKEGGARFLAAYPAIDRHLERLRGWSPADLAEEFLNRDWQPLAFAEVADAMEAVKCQFVGRATLLEHLADASLSPAMRPLLDAATSTRIAETMHDVAASTPWRRDIFRRGIAVPPAADQAATLGQITVIALDFDARSGPHWLSPDTTQPELYQPLIDALRDGPLSVARAAEIGSPRGQPIGAAAEAIALLMATGYAHPALPEPAVHRAAAPVRRLNEAIVEAVARGEQISYLVSPAAGCAMEASPLEVLTVRAMLSGTNADVPDAMLPAVADSLLPTVADALAASGRPVIRDGAPAEHADLARRMLRDTFGRVMRDRVPLFRRLGILPAAA